ncbi:MAG: glycosyltransferase family 4 protein [Candidatus Nealsonbacteria bacterium]|nr:glycosyltransferase family 4 protein [Candidatus Nealsonbacteria bacterium]
MPDLLLLCEYPTLNGGERSMLSTLAALAAARFKPAVIGPVEGPLADELRRREIEIVPFSIGDAAGRRRSQATLREELAELLRRRRPDLLHANSLSMGRLAGPVAADLGLPSIAHLRDIVRLSSQAMADLNCHTRLLAVSRATREFHVGRGLAGEKTHVLHNGVDIEQFRPRSKTGYLHRQLGIPAEARLVGTIGQICLRKGQDVLVSAAVSLAAQLPDVHYLIVGRRFSEKEESRQFEDDLKTAAGDSLAGRLHLLGVRDDVPTLLSELTMLVHPARQEPLGRVLLEAAAAGVPVIATDVGGTREIFPPQSRTARLIRPDNAEELAEAIGELASDASLGQQLASSARRRVEEAFDVRQAAAGLVEHYREVRS